MPRKPRIHYPGAHYHVMLRGNGGCDVFADAAILYRGVASCQVCIVGVNGDPDNFSFKLLQLLHAVIVSDNL